MKLRAITCTVALAGVIVIAPPHARAQSDPDTGLARDSILQVMKQAQKLERQRSLAALDSALVLFDSVRQMTIVRFGEADSLATSALVWQGVCYNRKAEFALCEARYLEAIDLWEQTLGPGHSNVANTKRMLANSYQKHGRYADAEPLFLEAIGLLEGMTDSGYVHASRLAAAYLDMGLLYMDQRRYQPALQMYLRARDIRYGLDGEESYYIGLITLYIGASFRRLGDYPEAEKYFLRSLEIHEAVRGPDHVDLVGPLSGLGTIYVLLDDPVRAQLYLARALDILETRGGDNFQIARAPLWRMAQAYLAQGDLLKAKEYYERELSIARRVYVDGPLQSFGTLSALAVIEHRLGNDVRSFEYFEEHLTANTEFVSNAFAYASEQQKLRYATQYHPISDRYLNFALTRNDNSITSACLQMVLQGKGLVIDALAAERSLALCSDDSRLEAKVKEHSNTCGQIASVVLAQEMRLSGAARTSQLQQLYEKKNALETELSSLCAEFAEYASASGVRVADVAAALPENAVLWEFLRFRSFDFEKVGQRDAFGNARYLVFTLERDGATEIKDLGPADTIDALVQECRRLLQSAPSAVLLNGRGTDEERVLAAVTRQLYNLIVVPLENSLTEKSRVIIGADGQLNLLPFAMLAMPDGRYAIEEYEFSYVSCGRDLAKEPVASAATSHEVVIMADPDYFERPAVTSDLHATLTWEGFDTPAMRGPPLESGCLGEPFRPIPATRAEADAIANLLEPNSDLITVPYFGTLASESALKGFEAPPHILHLATHGYFCAEHDWSSEQGLTDNPLLYSGLALAGANRIIMGEPADEGDGQDGILTSLEASGLNLIGTDLVVLSACQTGVGEVLDGEGVYGLRRAFQQAGARSVLMSMFDVPDRATRTLMERFYENWLSGSSKSAALREASLSILEQRRETHGVAHPLFWGGFILVGDPN